MTVKALRAAAALLLGMTGIGMSAPAAAQTVDAASSGAISMTVAPDSLGIPADDAPLHLTVTVTNGTSDALDPGVIDVNVNRNRLTDSDVLAGWLAAAEDGINATTPVGTVETGAIAAGETRIVAVDVAPDTLAFPGEGVYAVGVDLVTDADASVDPPGEVVAEAHTAISWKATSATAVNLAIAAPLVVPAISTGFIDADTLAEYTARDGLLSEQLSAMAGRPVAIGIDPRIIASIRVLGTLAPESALQWLEQLRTVPNVTFPLSYADSDLTAALDAGAAGVLSPTSFDYAIDPTRFAVAEATPTPGSQPDGNADPNAGPPLPTSADLTAWNYTLPTAAWPASGSLTTGTLTTLASTGYNPVIVSGDNVTVGDDGTSDVVATAAGTTLAVADSRLSDLLQSVVTAGTTAEWNAGMAELSATLALSSEVQGDVSRTVLATLGRSWSDSGYRLEQTLTTLAALPWAAGGSLPDALNAVSGGQATADTASVVDAARDDSRVAAVTSLLASEAADIVFANVAENPLAITAAQRLRLLSVLSNAWADDPDAFAVAVSESLDASTALRESVQISPSSTVNFGAERGPLPVVVANNLDQPVTVYITMRPSTIALKVEATAVEVVIEPQSSRRTLIPVNAVSSGQMQVTVSITDHLGQPVGTPTQVELNVRAGWETGGTIAFGIIVVLIFGLGIFRTIRKRRKDSSTAE